MLACNLFSCSFDADVSNLNESYCAQLLNTALLSVWFLIIPGPEVCCNLKTEG